MRPDIARSNVARPKVAGANVARPKVACPNVARPDVSRSNCARSNTIARSFHFNISNFDVARLNVTHLFHIQKVRALSNVADTVHVCDLCLCMSACHQRLSCSNSDIYNTRSPSRECK